MPDHAPSPGATARPPAAHARREAARCHRLWQQERFLRLLRERQLERLLQRLPPDGVPQAVRLLEEKIKRSEDRYKAARARERVAPGASSLAGQEGLAGYATDGADSVSAPVHELHHNLITLLQTEVAALGYDPHDPLFEEWLAEDIAEILRTAVRALGSLAKREAQRLADEVRRRTIEEEEWNAFKPERKRHDPDEEARTTWRLYRSLGF